MGSVEYATELTHFTTQDSFFYRIAFPEYKDWGRRNNYPSNIFPTIEISNRMFGEKFYFKRLDGNAV
jgi:hypothetical protein